jgi:hypothetical protein
MAVQGDEDDERQRTEDRDQNGENISVADLDQPSHSASKRAWIPLRERLELGNQCVVSSGFHTAILS